MMRLWYHPQEYGPNLYDLRLDPLQHLMLLKISEPHFPYIEKCEKGHLPHKTVVKIQRNDI